MYICFIKSFYLQYFVSKFIKDRVLCFTNSVIWKVTHMTRKHSFQFSIFLIFSYVLFNFIKLIYYSKIMYKICKNELNDLSFYRINIWCNYMIGLRNIRSSQFGRNATWRSNYLVNKTLTHVDTHNLTSLLTSTDWHRSPLVEAESVVLHACDVTGPSRRIRNKCVGFVYKFSYCFLSLPRPE